MEILKIQKTKDNKKNVFILKRDKHDRPYLYTKIYENYEIIYTNKKMLDNNNYLTDFFNHIEKIFKKHIDSIIDEEEDDKEEDEKPKEYFSDVLPDIDNVEIQLIINE
jgi:hypothetical protein